MKKIQHLLRAFLLLIFLLGNIYSFSQNNGNGNGGGNNGNNGNGGGNNGNGSGGGNNGAGGGNGGNSVPLNTGLIFLLFAGAAIGVIVLNKKTVIHQS